MCQSVTYLKKCQFNMLVLFSFIFVPVKEIIFGYNLLAPLNNYSKDLHCVESARIRGFYVPYFPAFGLHTERYRVSPHIPSKCGKIRSRETLNTGTFYAVLLANNLVEKPNNILYVIRPSIVAKNFWQKN